MSKPGEARDLFRQWLEEVLKDSQASAEALEHIANWPGPDGPQTANEIRQYAHNELSRVVGGMLERMVGLVAEAEGVSLSDLTPALPRNSRAH